MGVLKVAERTVPASQESKPLGWFERIGFGVGDLAGTLFFQMALLYLLYFYTDVAHIPPQWAATILIVARVFDAIANPVIGGLADRTRTRWGRYRPYLAAGALPLAALTFATFTVIDVPLPYRVGYALITYSLFSVSFAAVAIPYSALMAVMTRDPKESALLGTLRAGFGFSAGIVVSIAVLPIVHWSGNNARGFQIAVLALAAVGVPLLIFTALTSRERIESPSGAKLAARAIAKVIFNRPLVLLTATFMLLNISTMLRLATALYYFKYNIAAEQYAPAFFTTGSIATLLGIISTALLVRLLDKRAILIASMAVAGVGHLLAAALPQGLEVTFVCIGLLPALGLGLGAGVLWSMLTDCVDYAEWRTGRRAEGVCFGTAILGQKVSFALGGALSGWTLASVGYRSDVVQSTLALTGIHHLVGLYPGILMAVGVVTAAAYPLTERGTAELRLVINEQRSGPAEV